MKDEFIRKESVREISWKMCPDCEKECEFYFETEKEIWSEANFNHEIENEIVKLNIIQISAKYQSPNIEHLHQCCRF